MSKVDAIREKYPKIRENSFNLLVEGDRTPTKKYLERMCHYWSNKGLNKLYSKDLIETINNFDKLLPYIENKDMYSRFYDNYQTLWSVVYMAEQKKFDKEFVREEHAETIYESDKYLALRPITFKGSVKYGATTKWCTSGKNNLKLFNDYVKRSHLIYVMNKEQKNPQTNKMAILINKETPCDMFYCSNIELYNPGDTLVHIDWFINHGWDEEELIKIITNVRFNCYQKQKTEKIKTDVSTAVQTIKNLNLDDLFSNIEKLKNLDLITTNELEKNQVVIDDFLSKIAKFNSVINE